MMVRRDRVTKKVSSPVSKLNNRIAELENILRRIEQWETPWAGYTYHYGTMGQEKYIISLAMISRKNRILSTQTF